MEYTTTLAANEPIVISIGNFDGVHRGHQRLMHVLRQMAQELYCKPVVVTFSPHTLLVVRPDIDLKYLSTLEEKLALTKAYGSIADSIVIHFTREVAGMSATEFMDSLRASFPIKGMVVGANFSLGHNRMGDVTFLEHYGQEHGIVIHPIPLEEIERARISSTRIRALVSEGQITEAKELLGHPVMLSGIVIHGDHRGRLLGFPTANVITEPHKLLPANGVYAVRVTVEDGPGSGRPQGSDHTTHPSCVYNGVTNIGVRPTFNRKERIVETHVLDADLDLYDRHITVNFVARLRDEQRFAGIEALKAQIASDVQHARQSLQ